MAPLLVSPEYDSNFMASLPEADRLALDKIFVRNPFEGKDAQVFVSQVTLVLFYKKRIVFMLLLLLW